MARKIVGNAGPSYPAGGADPVGRFPGTALHRRALGLGSGRTGTEAGQHNAVFVDVDLTSVPDLLEVDVVHGLGETPMFCELVETENTGASVFAIARPVKKELWNATTCRVAVTLNGGTQDGTVLKFRVGGA